MNLVMSMGNLIQNQKGKVGEILKNNFLEGNKAAPVQDVNVRL